MKDTLSALSSLIAFILIFDWVLIPTLWFRWFLMGKKHANYYTKFDNFIYNLVYGHSIYNPTKDVVTRFLASLFALLSIILILV